MPKFRTLLLLAFLGSLLVILADVTACYWAIDRLRRNNAAQQHAAEISLELNQLQSTLIDAETGQRGYLITGNASYLEPYHEAVRQIGAEMAHLKVRLNSPEDQQLLSTLDRVIAAKLEELARTIQLRQERGLGAARAVVLTNAGKNWMDQARRLIGEREAASQRELSRNTAASQASGRAAIWTLAGTGVVNLLLLAGLVQIVSRIPERRRATAELNARLAAIVGSSEDAIIGLSPDGRITSWNLGAMRMYGYSAEEAIGQSLALIVPEDRRAEQESVVREVLAGNGVRNEEMLRKTKDGRLVEVSVSVSPLRDERGRIVGAAKIDRDIGPTRKAQRELRQAYSRLGWILSTIADGYIVVDREFRFREINAAAQRMVFNDRPVEELIGRQFWDLYPAGRESTFYAQYRHAMTTNEPVHFEAHSKIVDRWFETHAYPEPDRLEIFLRDITERKRHEQEVTALNRDLERRVLERTAQLEEVNRHLEGFAYTISHDLRAPLRSMAGFSQALQEDYAGALDATAQDYVRRIAAAATRMDALITDLLEFSRIQSAELPVQPVSLEGVLQQALQQLDADLRARGAAVNIKEPLGVVLAHPKTLVQIVANLLSNGVKFVASGASPALQIYTQPIDHGLRLWVEDNGIGIDADHQQRIFNLFERLHGSEVYPGTGIGLAIVKKGIERMGGACGVESSPGKGSRFWIELPKASIS